MASRRDRIGRGVFGDQRDELTPEEAGNLIYGDKNAIAEIDRKRGRRERIPLYMIRLDGGTQPRAALDEALIDEYAEEMKAGAEFPPGEVYYDGENFWLSGGYHRWYGRKRAGFEDMEVNVHQGTQRDAQLASVGENAEHGLRRTNEDKRRAVELLLRDAEWGKWSDREIARQCKVSQPFVSKLRAELSDNGYQIGKKTRLVERGGTQYKQKVSPKKRQPAQQPQPPASGPQTAPEQPSGVEPVGTWHDGASAHDVLLGKGNEFSSQGTAFDEVPEESVDAIALVAAQVIDGLYYLAKVSPDALREFDQAQLALLEGEYHKVILTMWGSIGRAVERVKGTIVQIREAKNERD